MVPKAPPGAASRKRPAVPPVYRPCPAQNAAQPKTAAPRVPPVYRPPVYRPAAAGVVLPKLAAAPRALKPATAPPVYRPAVTLQRLRTPSRGQPPRPAAARIGVVQCLLVGELRSALTDDKKFATNYKVWIAGKLKVTGLTEEKVIEKFSLPQLKNSADEYAVHRSNLDKVVDPIWEDAPLGSSIWTDRITYAQAFISEYYTNEVVAAILKSATLKAAAGAKLTGGAAAVKKLFAASVAVAGPEAFDTLFVKGAREREISLQDELLKLDFSLGMRQGEKFYLRLGSGTPSNDFHVPIHEFMHSLSSPIMKNFLGSDLNEGLTERIALIVMNEAGTPCTRPSYTAEREQVELLIGYLNKQGHPTADVYAAYFNLGLMNYPGLSDAIGEFRAL